MSPLLILALIFQLFTVCLFQTSKAGSSLEYVSKECNTKLTNINSLKDFRVFMTHYHDVIAEFEKSVNGSFKEARLEKCFDQKEKLIELEKIISNQQDSVCQVDFINKLIDYHMNHVAKVEPKTEKVSKGENLADTTKKRKFAAHIFSLFAHQVVYTCKSKLPDRVILANSKHHYEDLLDLFLPPEILRSSSDNERLRVFSEFLQNFDRIEDYALMLSKIDRIQPYYKTNVPPDAAKKIRKMQEMCKAREPYYTALFYPVYELSKLGYGVDEVPINSPILKCWLSTAQFCQGILRLRLNQEKTDAKPKISDHDYYIEIEFSMNEQTGGDKANGNSFEVNLPDFMMFKDHVNEITLNISSLVNRKSSLPTRIKKIFKLAKKLIWGHVKVDVNQNDITNHFMEMLTRGEDDLEMPVSLNGRRKDMGMYNPTRAMTDDTDTFVAVASLTQSQPLSFIMNCCVIAALLINYVFVLGVTGVRHTGKHFLGKTDILAGNYKEGARLKLEKAIATTRKHASEPSKSSKIFGSVYVAGHDG